MALFLIALLVVVPVLGAENVDVTHARLQPPSTPSIDAFLRPFMATRGVAWPLAAVQLPGSSAQLSTMSLSHASVTRFPGCAPHDVEAAVGHREGAVVSVARVNDSVAITLAASSTLGHTMAAALLARTARVVGGRVLLPAEFCGVHAPPAWASVRGHQFTDWGFSFEPFPSAAFSYVHDLVAFGTNQIEFAHIDWARGDLAKLQQYSQHLTELGVGMSVWYPLNLWQGATGRNQTEAFFSSTNLTSLFVPGGDGGAVLPPISFVDTVGDVAAVLRTYRPNATVWLSAQEYSVTNLTLLLGATDAPAVRKWLTGVVYGPHEVVPMAQFVTMVPAGVPVRQYPDLCHVVSSQYEVPRFDAALAQTHGRQVVNPRPVAHGGIVQLRANASFQAALVGFGAYSEGTNDDLNKCLWSAMMAGATPGGSLPPVEDVVDMYVNTFFDADAAPGMKALLYGLEANWDGPLLTNSHVMATLQTALFVAPTPSSTNWRQMAFVFRAVYDAVVARRLQVARQQCNAAYEQLAAAVSPGTVDAAIDAARKALSLMKPDPVLANWTATVSSLAAALNSTIGASVLQAQDPTLGVGRLTTVPLDDTAFLSHELESTSALPSGEARLDAVRAVLNHTDPGPGGFYDDLSAVAPGSHPRLQPGQGPVEDPSFYFTPLHDVGASTPSMTTRAAWRASHLTFYGNNLTLVYDGLSPSLPYTLAVVLQADSASAVPTQRLVADGQHTLMDYAPVPFPMAVLRMDVPPAATADGKLVVTCNQPPDISGSGRGCRISEVWLGIKGQ